MTLHIDQLPPEIERALEQRALATGSSVTDVVVEALREALHVKKRRDLSDIQGMHELDEEFFKALEEQRRIDPEDWK